MSTIGDALLVHGFTFGDVDRLARITVARARSFGWDYADRYDAVWHGIVEALYSANDTPSEYDLMQAGWATFTREVSDDLRHHGRANDTGDVGPRYARHWTNLGSTLEDRVVESVAAAQVLPMLTPDQCEAIVALASHDTLAAAAAQLGLTEDAMRSRVRRARETFIAWWHEHETPHQCGEDTCANGHAWATNTRTTPCGDRRCRSCESEAKRRWRQQRTAA